MFLFARAGNGLAFSVGASTAAIVLLIIGAVVGAVFCAIRRVKVTPLALWLKVGATVLITAGIAVLVFSQLQTAYRLALIAVLVGFVFCAAGDLFLDLQYLVDEKKLAVYRCLGIGSFAVAQLGFTLYFVAFGGYHVLVSVVAAVLAAFYFLLQKPIFHCTFGSHLPLCVFYLFTLMQTVFIGFYGVIMLWQTALVPMAAMFFAGGVMFMLSDMLLTTCFYGRTNTQWMVTVLHVLYYLAIVFMAVSVLIAG